MGSRQVVILQFCHRNPAPVSRKCCRIRIGCNTIRRIRFVGLLRSSCLRTFTGYRCCLCCINRHLPDFMRKDMPDLPGPSGYVYDSDSHSRQQSSQRFPSLLTFSRTVGEFPHACQQPFGRTLMKKVIKCSIFCWNACLISATIAARLHRFILYQLILHCFFLFPFHHKHRNGFHRNFLLRDPQGNLIFLPCLFCKAHPNKRAHFTASCRVFTSSVISFFTLAERMFSSIL